MVIGMRTFVTELENYMRRELEIGQAMRNSVLASITWGVADVSGAGFEAKEALTKSASLISDMFFAGGQTMSHRNVNKGWSNYQFGPQSEMMRGAALEGGMRPTVPQAPPVLFPVRIPGRQNAPLGLGELKFNSEKGHYEIIQGGKVTVPVGRYIFVTTKEGKILIGNETRVFDPTQPHHSELANNQPVRFAGEVVFKGGASKGQIRNWNAQSGSYEPDQAKASQAGLPMDQFRQKNFK